MTKEQLSNMAGEKQDVVETPAVKEEPKAPAPKSTGSHDKKEQQNGNNNSKPIQKRDLWLDPLVRKVGDSTVHMTGVGSSCHTVFARVADGPALTIGDVVDTMVDAGWKHIAKEILEKRQHIATDSYPPAKQLLELGAVWLLNETSYTKSHDAHAHRLNVDEESMKPEWKDMTLRVHYVPDRFHAASQYDWTKYCRGLLVGNTVQARIGGEVPHVPVPQGLPDTKDGVIVYEDPELGFAIVNKPGEMPIHATISNHAEDVVSMFRKGLEERRPKNTPHVTVLQRFSTTLDTETSGLLALSTRSEFASYITKMAEKKPSDPQHLLKKFRCLVCVKDPETMDVLEEYQQSGKVVTHYMDPRAKIFSETKPAKGNFQTCQMKILRVGDERFRAACVRSIYRNSVDSCLAHRLWGPESKKPAEQLGVQYVMELEIELVTTKKHQLRGQLAALGFPVVGDHLHGGGKCDVHADRHSWHRMALQCCELSFMEPKECGKKKEMIATDKKCFFRLEQAWWTEYLAQYEMYQRSLADEE